MANKVAILHLPNTYPTGRSLLRLSRDVLQLRIG